MLLPSLDSDSMNSHGATKVQDVAEYIFWEDALYKSLTNPPSQKGRRTDNNKNYSANEYIELILMTKIEDVNTRSILQITLAPNLHLDTVKRYLFDLIEIENRVK